MSYITKQDLIDELGAAKLLELADDSGQGDVGDLSDDGEIGQAIDKRIDRAIAYAQGTFDGYARTRYTIPVVATIKVKSLCIDLAVFHLFKSRATNATKDSVYGVKKDAHDAALKFLTDVSTGKAALDVPSAEETV